MRFFFPQFLQVRTDAGASAEESPVGRAPAVVSMRRGYRIAAAGSEGRSGGRGADIIGRVPSLIECVPNFSEGRRQEVLDRICATISQVAGVTLLDASRDETHNRSVVTFAGTPEPVVRAATAAVGRALELIDMERHTGAHPRIGAVDVIPFVPLATTPMGDAVQLARRFGEHIAERFELPVYLYGEAAQRPERRSLAHVRRGQYEGLRTEIGVNPDRDPDFGPRRLHPRGGAVAVGARKPLIAFNVNLATDDVAIAKRIAAEIRESSGGLPAVQAMGLLLANPGERRHAQVSMNLLDWERTGIPAVLAEIERRAEEAGTAVDHCELIGLAPAAALLDVARHTLRLRHFSTEQALELRLARER
jgi:glutamate formiminotransferase